MANEKRKGGPPVELTPEYIAEQRALREARKKAKREAKAAKGEPIDDQPAFDLSFVKRPMLDIPDTAPYASGLNVKIMTYNALAQCLIRRKLFPENGNALKWKWRGRVLANEISHYSPDIICMQEIDSDKIDSFWKPELAKIGLETHFMTFPGKRHGNIIAFNTRMFSLVTQRLVNYDEIETPGADKQFNTRNTGMLVALKAKEYEDFGLVLGTSHMFWHPMGSFERTRQLAVFVDKATEFKTHFPNHWPVLLAGDYNSECFDTPYLCASTHPLQLTQDALDILHNSAAHSFAKVKPEEEEEDDEEEAEEAADTNEQTEGPSEEDRKQGAQKVESLLFFYRSLEMQTVSLYGERYKTVHPENVHPKSLNGEPFFSNWAHAWRGLLDYIFVLKSKSDTTPNLRDEIAKNIKVLQLLRIPEPSEMGDEPSGQPREGQYPSDHLCLMAKISLNTNQS
ncbi:hypothetical protein TRICI_001706 [Trichomonascus ciferrii]|uniref:Endonuclease/exonuclease/phosphatase domain-containing protein n=1 Tax=Trichomonascus ciferrii TaxID=44093 RepID=A0A642V9A2_9ASCO|nr:hypothetical protein TRICI_001706 [Trichomonascus ciferrii]